MKWLIVLIPLMFLSGCVSNDIHDYYKDGVVIGIDEDVMFGASFTDWRHDVCFDDGTVLWLERESDISKIRLDEFGEYHFVTNFFEYEGTNYEFYRLIDVEYYEG